MRSRIVPGVAILGIVALLSLHARPAFSMARTLKRSTENLTQGVLDVGLQPVTSGTTFSKGFLLSDNYSLGVKAALTPVVLPTMIFYCGFVSTFAGTWRAVDGALAFPLGLAYLFSDKDITLMYDNPKSFPAIVNQETKFFRFNFGNRYCEGK